MEVDINPSKINEHFHNPGLNKEDFDEFQNEPDYEVVHAPICDLMQKLIRKLTLQEKNMAR